MHFNPVGLVFIAIGVLAIFARHAVRDMAARWTRFSIRVELPDWWYSAEAWIIGILAIAAGLVLSVSGR